MREQGSLFEPAAPEMPAGLASREEFVSANEESALLTEAEKLPFAPFQFHGWTGNRETVSFGWRYDFSQARVERAPPIPDFLQPLRARAAEFMGIAPDALEQALVIRYGVGAGMAGDTIASRWTRRRARPIYCATGSGTTGSTASLPWTRSVIRSPSGAGRTRPPRRQWRSSRSAA